MYKYFEMFQRFWKTYEIHLFKMFLNLELHKNCLNEDASWKSGGAVPRVFKVVSPSLEVLESILIVGESSCYENEP